MLGDKSSIKIVKNLLGHIFSKTGKRSPDTLLFT